ncbi:MAG: radical SAM protein [Anaerolineae bacterium]|nr:radical SAM protein [Anaerolineae bacterium]
MDDVRWIGDTESVCPECLQKIPARRMRRGEDVFLIKTCPRHGEFNTVIWRGKPDFETWDKPKIPVHPEITFTEVQHGCPYDCGLCVEHNQEPCCVLMEVTQRCDLGCPVCFAAAGGASADPDLNKINFWYERLLQAGGPFNIQLSGGEPCLRDDLPEIINLGRERGFTYFQVNTNGLRLSKEVNYLKELKQAGLSLIYLQFDGMTDDVYEKLRGRKLLTSKITLVEHCAEMGLGVILVPTLAAGVNINQVGAILRFALSYHPVVRGIHFQPLTYFGRYPFSPQNEDRLTLPEIMRLLEQQSDGLVKTVHFKPSGAENARCSFHGNFVVMPDESLRPLTRHSADACCNKPASARQGRIKAQAFVSRNWPLPEISPDKKQSDPVLGEWDAFLERARTHGLAISAMAFQDAWTMDLERLKQCYIMTLAPDGRLIPFCAYNLSSRSGETLYRGRSGE